VAGGVRLSIRLTVRGAWRTLRPAGPWWALALLAIFGALVVWSIDHAGPGAALGGLTSAGRLGEAGGPGATNLAARLDWQPALALLQPWRSVTAAWVHLSGQHLVGNLAGAVLVAAYGRAAGCGRRAALAWALAWPLTHAALALQPTLLYYGGLSGLMHAGVAVASWQLLRGARGQRRAVGAAVLAMMVLKLLLEAPWQGGPLRQEPGWDIAIAPLAHSTGALAGLLCAVVFGVGNVAGRRAAPSA
jgi:rhomboid family GlyGly-CTERM serine protease